MKISVVTVAYNAHSSIDTTLKSVAEQTHPDMEYIIIDGGSTDGTQAYVKHHAKRLTHFISEPDGGIYDAMNKGLKLATGDVIGFINADDFYASSTVLSNVAAVFNNSNVDACYGDLCYVQQQDISTLVRYWQSSDFRPGSFASGWCPPHPTFFVRREIYERFGYFDLSYKLAADVELMMRFLEVHRIRSEHIPKVLVKMRMGGATNRSIKNIVSQNYEIFHALKHHGLPASLFTLLGNKLISRGRQFFLHPSTISG